MGHRWVGELADYRFYVKYRPGKVNVSTDTLSHLHDIATDVTKCTESLTREIIQATWEGCESARRQDIAMLLP